MKPFQKSAFWIAVLIIVMSQLACRLAIAGLQEQITAIPSPTNTPVVTLTFTPTATSTPTTTPVPTSTSTPTSTPTPVFLVEQGTGVPAQLPSIRIETASMVSALAEWQVESVVDLEWLVDGSLLAVADESQIDLYQVDTRQILRSLYPGKNGLVKIAFSPDGQWLVSGSRSGDEKSGYSSSLELWYGANWKPMGLLYGTAGGLNDICFTPDGKYMAVVYSEPLPRGSNIDFWETSSWLINTNMEAGSILQVAISPDSTYLATSPDRFDIRVWDLEQNAFLYRIPTSFTGAVNRLAFSPDSGVLASGHYDGFVRLWNVENGDLLIAFETGSVVESLTFSPDGQILAIGGAFENSLIQLRSAGSGALLRTLDIPSAGISHLSFSPDGKYLVSASYDGTMRLWGIRPE